MTQNLSDREVDCWERYLVSFSIHLILQQVTLGVRAYPGSAINTFESRLNIKRVGLIICNSTSLSGLMILNVRHKSLTLLRTPISSINWRPNIRQPGEPEFGYKTGLKNCEIKLSTAERAVVEFKTKNNIVSTGGVDKPLLSRATSGRT